MPKKIIGILGGGKWGTVLGQKLSQTYQVQLYSRDLKSTDYKRIGDVEYFKDFSALQGSDLLMMAVPSFAIREVATKFTPFYSGQSVIGVAKGIEKETGFLPSQIIKEIWPAAQYAHLSGPSFAAEVSQDLPVVVSLAMADLKQKENFQEIINLKDFKIELTEDLIGVQLGGALKNVIAIASGLSDGLGLGESFRAALILAGLKDMISLGKVLGAKEETFLGFSGLGDLILTATSSQSRNYRLGKAISQNVKLKDRLAGNTFEGIITACEAYALSQKFNLRLPVIEGVYRVICQNQNPAKVFKEIQNELC